MKHTKNVIVLSAWFISWDSESRVKPFVENKMEITQVCPTYFLVLFSRAICISESHLARSHPTGALGRAEGRVRWRRRRHLCDQAKNLPYPHVPKPPGCSQLSLSYWGIWGRHHTVEPKDQLPFLSDPDHRTNSTSERGVGTEVEKQGQPEPQTRARDRWNGLRRGVRRHTEQSERVWTTCRY